ncbi:hypothetical protein ACJX0J_034883 [Zea mays]
MDPNAATHPDRLTNQGSYTTIIGNVILCDWIITTDHSFSFQALIPSSEKNCISLSFLVLHEIILLTTYKCKLSTLIMEFSHEVMILFYLAPVIEVLFVFFILLNIIFTILHQYGVGSYCYEVPFSMHHSLVV